MGKKNRAKSGSQVSLTVLNCALYGFDHHYPYCGRITVAACARAPQTLERTNREEDEKDGAVATEVGHAVHRQSSGGGEKEGEAGNTPTEEQGGRDRIDSYVK